jgi:hypothetical protein
MLDWGFPNRKKHKPLTIVWACWAPWVSQGTTSSFEQEVQLQNMWLQIILWASRKSLLTKKIQPGGKWHSLFRASSNLLASCCSLLKYFTVCNPTPEVRCYQYKGLGPLLPYTCGFAIQPVPKPPEMSEKEEMKASCNSPHSWWESQLPWSLLHYLLCSCPAGTLFATICHACAMKQPIFSLDTDFTWPIWACSLLRTSYKRETEI